MYLNSSKGVEHLKARVKYKHQHILWNLHFLPLNLSDYEWITYTTNSTQLRELPFPGTRWLLLQEWFIASLFKWHPNHITVENQLFWVAQQGVWCFLEMRTLWSCCRFRGKDLFSISSSSLKSNAFRMELCSNRIWYQVSDSLFAII